MSFAVTTERDPDAAKLVCDIVVDSFGHDSGTVCTALIQNGQRTLRELIRDTGLRPSRCQHALLVLIQHNCVLPQQLQRNPRDLDNHNDDGGEVSYEIQMGHVLHRLRYPRFLLHVRECMSETHVILLEGLLEHGRLRSHQLFARATASPDYAEQEKSAVPLDKVFSQLVEGRFVERVPVGYVSQHSEDAAGVTALLSDDALWRVNADEFNRRFRHIACAALVREKVDEAAGHLLSTMLEITRTRETKVNEERSTAVSEADILQKLCDSDTHIDTERIKRVLGKLAADTSELISNVGDNHGGANYCVNMRRIVDLIRIKEVEAVVRERFGGPACRIFRLLLLKRNLEQKQIAEMAMIPVKDTRELLYKLLKAEYVQIQEVARTSDHAPSRTFYLWRVDLLHVVEQVGHELYRTTSNLRARLIHELSQERETLMLLERAQDKIARGGESTVALTSGQRLNLVRMRTIATRLESSLLRLDELVLIFNVM